MKTLIPVILVFSATTANAALPWAKLDSPHAQVEFLAASHRAIPPMLNAPATFDTDVAALLAIQNEVRARMRNAPAYARLLETRPDPLLFDVDVSGAHVESESLSPKALGAWRSELGSILAEATKSGMPSSRSELARRIDRELHVELQAGQLLKERGLALAELRTLALLDAGSEYDPALEGLRGWIDNLNEGDLDIFHEADAIRRGLGGSGLSQDQVTDLVGALDTHVTAIAAQRVRSLSTFSGRMTIEDVPPDLAILRGFFGDDCATKYSASYPNSPLERTFYIYDENGAPLAYAAATHILFGGKPALYLHTINGPNITTAQADEVLRAFDSLKPRLGVERIVLPIPKRINENMNFSRIKSAYYAAVEGGYEDGIQYRDSEVRWILNQTTESHYDREDANTRGIEYAPKPRSSDAAKAKVQERPYAEARALKAYEPAGQIDVLMLSYGLALSGRRNAAGWALNAEGLPSSRFNALARLLASSDGLGTEAYQGEVQAFARQLGHAPGRDPLRDYASYFSRGKLLASDALSPAHAEATVAGVMELLRAGEAKAAAQVVRRNPAVFEASAAFRELVAGLPIGSCEPLWEAGLDPALFPNQLAELKASLGSVAWWEATRAAHDLLVMTPRQPALFDEVTAALSGSRDPRVRARVGLDILKTKTDDYLARLLAISAFTHSAADSRLSPSAIVEGASLISMPVPRGVPYALSRTLRAIAGDEDTEDEVRAKASSIADFWDGEECNLDLKHAKSPAK